MVSYATYVNVLGCEHYFVTHFPASSFYLKILPYGFFFSLSGTVFMPPKWSLGYHQCRWSYLSDQRVLEVLGFFSTVMTLELVAYLHSYM